MDGFSFMALEEDMECEIPISFHSSDYVFVYSFLVVVGSYRSYFE